MEPPQYSAMARTNHIVTQPQMPSLVGINTHQQTPLRPAMACALRAVLVAIMVENSGVLSDRWQVKRYTSALILLDCRKEYIIVLEAFNELEQSLKLDNILLQGRDRLFTRVRRSGPILVSQFPDKSMSQILDMYLSKVPDW